MPKDLVDELRKVLRVACDAVVPTLPPGTDEQPRTGFMARYVTATTRKEIVLAVPRLFELFDAPGWTSSFVKAKGWGENTQVKLVAIATHKDHLSSYQSRVEADGFWGGGVIPPAVKDLLHGLAISGLPEIYDEAIVLSSLAALALIDSTTIKVIVGFSENTAMVEVMQLMIDSGMLEAQALANLAGVFADFS